MRPKTSLKAISSLLRKPLFTSKDSRLLGVPPSILAYYVKVGDLERITRGVYKSPYSTFTDRWSDLAESAYATPGGVICLLSALAVYNLTEEIPRQHWIAIPHSTSVKSTRENKIVRFRNIELGKVSINLDGLKVSIFDRERTIIDAFRLLSRETAIKALRVALTVRGKNRLNLKKLEEYSRKLRFDIEPYLLSATL